jgi:hypothetical protein
MRTSLLDEILTVSKLSWHSFTQRWRRYTSALIATFGVVAVFVSVISMAAGYREDHVQNRRVWQRAEKCFSARRRKCGVPAA